MARARTRLLAVRISEEMLRDLDSRGETLQRRYSWATIRRTDIVRVLLVRGLERPALDTVPSDPIRADHLLSVRLPVELLEDLESRTRTLGPTISRSDLVRALLARELAAPDPEVDASSR